MQQKLSQEDVTESQPYSLLAKIYDQFMNHVNYQEWLDYILILCHRNRHVPAKILDCACGTGNFTTRLFKSGFHVTGMDGSMAMLRIAREKCEKAKFPCRLIQSHLQALPLKNKFDTILCLYDSINYVAGLDRLKTVFQEFLGNLTSEGVFIFDAGTEYNSFTNFRNVTYKNEYDKKYELIFHSHYDRQHKKQISEFTITDKHTKKTSREVHVQYLYSVDEIYGILKEIGVGRIRMYKDYSFSAPDAATERIHFYVEKEV